MAENIDGNLAALKMFGVDTDALIKRAGVEPNAPEVVTPEQKNEPTVTEINTPLFKQTFVPNPEQIAPEENFADIKVLSNYAKENGFEINTPQDLKKVFESHKALMVEKEALKVQADEAEYLKNLLNSLPTEIANPFAQWLNKGDYKATIKEMAANPFDLNKDFSTFGEKEVKNVIDHYYPDKYDSDEWEELDDKVKDTIKESAALRYSTERNKFLSFQEEQEKQIILRKQMFSQSVNNSISNLRKNNPSLSDTELKEVEKAMYGGLNERLTNADGTYKDNAAEDVAFVLYGKQTLDTLQQNLNSKMQAEINKQIGKANEEIVMRNSDKAPMNPGGDDPNVVSQIVKQQTSFLKKKQLFQD